MNKDELVAVLQEAARTHKEWVDNALALIKGVSLDQGKVPVNASGCKFGRWYYGEGQRLREINGFKEIEALHDGLHETYLEIFEILFGKGYDVPLLKKLFGSPSKINEEKRAAAMGKYSLLEKQSDTIMKQLAYLEKMITAMSGKQLERYLTA